MFTFSNSITGNGIVITGFKDISGSTLVIPSSIKGRRVKEIAPRAFYGAAFSKAVLPAGLEVIGEESFANAKLKAIVMAGDEEFAEQRISTLSVNHIADRAFQNANLQHIVFPSEKLVLGKQAFAGCENLGEVVFNPNMTLILEDEAFLHSNVSCVVFPNVPFELPKRAFANCTELTTIAGRAKTIGEACFDSCSQLKDIRLTHTERISRFAFCFCQSIQRFNVLSTINTIDPGAFAITNNLDFFRVAPENPHFVSIDGVVYTHDKATLIAFPCRRRGAFHVLPGVREIGEEAFSESQLRELTLPPSVQKVHSRALIACLSLRKLTLPDRLTINLEDAIAMVTPGLTVHYQGSKESALANLSGMDAFSDLQVTCLDANGKEIPLFEEDPPKSVHIRWDENGKFVL